MIIEQAKPSWRIAGSVVILLFLLVTVLYQETVLYLVGLWNQIDIGEYAHGYLVLAISAYLIFINREKLSALTPCPEYRALLLVAAASVLWMIAVLVDVQMVQTVGLLFLVLALVWTVLGNQVIRILAFPILFIAFAIPVWFPLSPVLQNLTADAVFGAIRLLGVPAFRQDNMIVLPAGTLSVEEACSGLRYLLAALTLGTLYAYINYSSLRTRLIVVLVVAGSAVLANLLRVFIVVYLGYTTDMQHPLVHDHLSLGWYLFGGLVVILLFIDARLHNARCQAGAGEADVQQDSTTIRNRKPGYSHYAVYGIAISLLLAVAPAAVFQLNNYSVNEISSTVPELPQQAGGWTRVSGETDSWMPVYHGAVNQKQIYKKGNNKVVLYMGYYSTQKQGEELINDLNHINNKKVWRATYPKSRKQNAGDQFVLEQLLDNRNEYPRLVWYWYNIAGTITTNKYEAKLLQVFGLLKGESWAYVTAVAVPTGEDVDTARQILKDFMQSIEKPMK